MPLEFGTLDVYVSECKIIINLVKQGK